MMPMTPSGTRTRAMSRPLGRVHCATVVPTGSASAAISSTPRAMPSMRLSSSASLSSIAPERPLARAASMSRTLAANNSALRERNDAAIFASARFFAAVLASASAAAAATASRPSPSMTVEMFAFSVWAAAFTGVLSNRSQIRAHQHEIIAMNHFGAAAEAEHRLEIGAALADDADRIPVAVGNHAARDFRTVDVQHTHSVAAFEPAADRGDARGQQTLPRP